MFTEHEYRMLYDAVHFVIDVNKINNKTMPEEYYVLLGKLIVEGNIPLGPEVFVEETEERCPDCNGLGLIPTSVDDEDWCERCDGTGNIGV